MLFCAISWAIKNQSGAVLTSDALLVDPPHLSDWDPQQPGQGTGLLIQAVAPSGRSAECLGRVDTIEADETRRHRTAAARSTTAWPTRLPK